MADNDSTTAIPKAEPVTAHVPFFSIGKRPLLAVCEGVPSIDALEQASSLLAEALAAAYSAAANENGSLMFAAAHMTEMAKAVLDSAVRNMVREARHD